MNALRAGGDTSLEADHWLGGKPEGICCDNGPENIRETIRRWSDDWDVWFEHIQLGRPHQNAYVKRFNCMVCTSGCRNIIGATWKRQGCTSRTGCGFTP